MRPVWSRLLLQCTVLMLLLLAACPQVEADKPVAGLDGAKLYADRRCGICHGEKREGKEKLGPPLTNMAQHWTVDKLVNDYFPNPVAYQDADPRLREMLKTYSAMKMPPVLGKEEELRALAEWLLTDPQ